MNCKASRWRKGSKSAKNDHVNEKLRDLNETLAEENLADEKTMEGKEKGGRPPLGTGP